MRFDIWPQAATDLLEQAQYLEERGLNLGHRFLEAAAAAFQDLLERPGMGSAYPATNRELKGLRKWHVPGFRKYQIFYRPTNGGIEIVRVIHGARDVPRILQEET